MIIYNKQKQKPHMFCGGDAIKMCTRQKLQYCSSKKQNETRKYIIITYVLLCYATLDCTRFASCINNVLNTRLEPFVAGVRVR